jgi:hypothetical protein
MSTYRMADVARLLGVSDDTARRWAETGRFASTTDQTGHLAVDGAELARFATTLSDAAEPGQVVHASARNRLVGIVTKVFATPSWLRSRCSAAASASFPSSAARRPMSWS